MKKTITLMFVLVAAIILSTNTYGQQGKWAGNVKYDLKWTGNVPQGVPTSFTEKVYNDLQGTDFMTYAQMGSLAKTIFNSGNNTVIMMFDFSMFPDEGPTEGMSGKWYVKKKVKLEDFTTKYTYTGITKELAGLKCEQVISETTNKETGEVEKDTCFVTKEIGPKINLSYYQGLDAFPMEYSIQIGEGLSVTLTASELQKGKVKEEDLLLESGYEEISEEDFIDMLKKLQGAAEEDSDDL